MMKEIPIMAAGKFAYIVYRDYADAVRMVRGHSSLERALDTARRLHKPAAPHGDSHYRGGPDICGAWQPDSLRRARVRCQGRFEIVEFGTHSTRACSVEIRRIPLAD
jgi:hypothetical protein